MRIRILTITHKTPNWVYDAFNEYHKRLQSFASIELVEISAEKRSASSNETQLIQRDSEKMLAALKPHHLKVVLEIKGQQWTSEELAAKLSDWRNQGHSIDFMIGGANGLSSACIESADVKWSLSKLTFPHALVKVLVIEQLYRSYCLLRGHPYHK